MSGPFTYSREEIIDGTGWPDEARFVLVTDGSDDAAGALRRFADDLDSAGMPEAAELAREAARNPDATL